MAEKWISKASVLIKGVSHDWLDSLMDANAVPVLKQRIRDLEEVEDRMVDEAAGALAAATGAANRIATLASQRDSHIAAATQFANDSIPENDADAEVHALEAVRIEDIIKLEESGAAQLKAVSAKYAEVKSALASTKAQLIIKLRRLEVVTANIEANEQATETLEGLQGVLDATQTGGIDDTTARAEARLQASNAKLGARLGRVSTGVAADPNKARAAALLAGLRKPQGATAK